MERRLRSFATAPGHHDLDGYLAALRKDVVARAAFLDHMTINVSELFRNPERFAELERRFLPELLGGAAREGPAASGAPGAPTAPSPTRSRSCSSRPPRARGTSWWRPTSTRRSWPGRATAIFTAPDLQNVTPERRRALVRARCPDGGFRAVARAARDGPLLPARPAEGPAIPRTRDLILCRNVVIYFNEDAKERIYERFMEALRPGGVALRGVHRAGQRRRPARVGAAGDLLLPPPRATPGGLILR